MLVLEYNFTCTSFLLLCTILCLALNPKTHSSVVNYDSDVLLCESFIIPGACCAREERCFPRWKYLEDAHWICQPGLLQDFTN